MLVGTPAAGGVAGAPADGGVAGGATDAEAFVAFAKVLRPEVKAAGPSLTDAEVEQKLHDAWGLMKPPSKAPFVQLAAREKATATPSSSSGGGDDTLSA